jgi:PAS domain S-box-containing protein
MDGDLAPEAGRDGPHASRADVDLGARYRSLFVEHPHAVFAVDPDGVFVETNPAAGAVSGHDPAALLGRSFADLVVERDRPRALVAFADALQRRPQRLELAIHHAAGGQVELDVTAIPLVVEDEVLGVYGIAEDVTSRNRTARELEVTRRLAASAGEVKADFLSRISHEIRTPLTGILAAAELLQETGPDEEQRALVDTVSRSAHRLSRLVDNVLSFADPDPAVDDADLEDLDLLAVVEDAVALARASARLKGLTVVLEVADDVPRRLRDHPTWTTQILDNLLSNAVAFTDAGEIVLSVSTTTTDHVGPAILYRVTDTGIGIDPSDLDRVWEPFGHAASARSRSRTGMGLAIVKQLATISGGSVAVNSTPGRGSTFSVLVPVRSRATR